MCIWYVYLSDLSAVCWEKLSTAYIGIMSILTSPSRLSLSFKIGFIALSLLSLPSLPDFFSFNYHDCFYLSLIFAFTCQSNLSLTSKGFPSYSCLLLKSNTLIYDYKIFHSIPEVAHIWQQIYGAISAKSDLNLEIS